MASEKESRPDPAKGLSTQSRGSRGRGGTRGGGPRGRRGRPAPPRSVDRNQQAAGQSQTAAPVETAQAVDAMLPEAGTTAPLVSTQEPPSVDSMPPEPIRDPEVSSDACEAGPAEPAAPTPPSERAWPEPRAMRRDSRHSLSRESLQSNRWSQRLSSRSTRSSGLLKTPWMTWMRFSRLWSSQSVRRLLMSRRSKL